MGTLSAIPLGLLISHVRIPIEGIDVSSSATLASFTR